MTSPNCRQARPPRCNVHNGNFVVLDFKKKVLKFSKCSSVREKPCDTLLLSSTPSSRAATSRSVQRSPSPRDREKRRCFRPREGSFPRSVQSQLRSSHVIGKLVSPSGQFSPCHGEIFLLDLEKMCFNYQEVFFHVGDNRRERW